MLLQQLDVVHRHAAIHRFAHVVNGEQGDLHGGEGFHLHAGLADGLCRGCTDDGRGLIARLAIAHDLEIDRHTGQRQRMAQRDQVAGFFGGLNARDARNTQHVALFGAACFDDGQRGGQHVDTAHGGGFAVRAGLGGDVDHVRLAVGIEVGERGGEWRCD